MNIAPLTCDDDVIVDAGCPEAVPGNGQGRGLGPGVGPLHQQLGGGQGRGEVASGHQVHLRHSSVTADYGSALPAVGSR